MSIYFCYCLHSFRTTTSNLLPVHKSYYKFMPRIKVMSCIRCYYCFERVAIIQNTLYYLQLLKCRINQLNDSSDLCHHYSYFYRRARPWVKKMTLHSAAQRSDWSTAERSWSGVNSSKPGTEMLSKPVINIIAAVWLSASVCHRRTCFLCEFMAR